MTKEAEGAYSLKELNQLTLSERVTKAHPGNLHLWWNRSPIGSSARLLQETIGNKAGNTATQGITAVDPFSGSGCLTLAALQSDLPVMAGDLNAVAAAITKAVSEVPARFKDTSPVSPEAEVKFYSGYQGLAEDIRHYGGWVRGELNKRLSGCYPNTGEGKAYAWIWTRTSPCPNPACGCRMPLATSYVLSRLKGRELHVQPVAKDSHVDFVSLPGAPKEASDGNKIGKQGAQFRCPQCGTITKDAYIKQAGQTGELGLQLMAVCVASENGKKYVTPDGAQLAAATVVTPQELPAGDLPDNTRWFSPPLFGMKSYTDLYTPRQLLLMTTLCDLVVEVQEKCRNDALAAGFADDGVSLSGGGVGAEAYSQAIVLYLSFVVGKLANYQSTICTWDNRTGNLRAAFTRQAIPMTWTFAEGNPFSSVTGNYDAMLSDVVTAVENLRINNSATVVKADARNFPYPPNSMLFTELPYYDNVGYADLSDYFYIWLRRCMKNILQGYFDGIVSSKEELSSIAEHYGGDKQLAVDSYEAGLRIFFRQFHAFATTAVPSIVFFEFGKRPEQWEEIMDAIISAGFQVKEILPIRTELPKENYETFRAAIVFRPREENSTQTLRRTFVGELKRELPEILDERFRADMYEYDRHAIGIGCGLSLFSTYEQVLNADGSTMLVHDALQLIWAEVTDYLQSYDSDRKHEEDGYNGREY